MFYVYAGVISVETKRHAGGHQVAGMRRVRCRARRAAFILRLTVASHRRHSVRRGTSAGRSCGHHPRLTGGARGPQTRKEADQCGQHQECTKEPLHFRKYNHAVANQPPAGRRTCGLHAVVVLVAHGAERGQGPCRCGGTTTRTGARPLNRNTRPAAEAVLSRKCC